ncbi:hypothetical protein ES708_29307 [subsurface metagenome]
MKWLETKNSLILSLKQANKEQAEIIERFFEQSREQLEKIKRLEWKIKMLKQALREENRL